MIAGTVIAPEPPGSLGAHVDPMRLRDYIISMDGWLEARKQELDDLDLIAQNAAEADDSQARSEGNSATGDIRLGMSLWQSIQNRFVRMLQVWDNGRVGQKEQEEISALIWGRLDEQSEASAAKGLSVPEACRLSDALTAALRTKLHVDPDTSALASRIRSLRATMERLRDQVKLEPAETAGQAQAYLDQLTARVDDLEEKSGRGGDVGGIIGPLEIDAAKFERDMIVGGAQRRQREDRQDVAGHGPSQSTQQPVGSSVADRVRADLVARAHRVSALAKQVQAAVPNAPDLKVPDVAVLGPVPADPAAAEQYLTKLKAMDASMTIVEEAYTKALGESQIAPNAVKMVRADLAERGITDEDAEALVDVAERLTERTPVPLEAVDAVLRAARLLADTQTQPKAGQ